MQHPLAGEGSSSVYTFEMVDLQTRAKYYGAPIAHEEEPSTSQNPSAPNNFHIERPVANLVIFPHKGALRCTTHNTSARATQNYNIVEVLVQAPSAMSTLEVLQTCLEQRKALLSIIGGIDP